jgi:hypothetical protein
LTKKRRPAVGEKVLLKGLPKGFLANLPASDKRAISTMIGRRVLLVAYDADDRAELEFVDAKGVIHYIYVDPRFISEEVNR